MKPLLNRSASNSRQSKAPTPPASSCTTKRPLTSSAKRSGRQDAQWKESLQETTEAIIRVRELVRNIDWQFSTPEEEQATEQASRAAFVGIMQEREASRQEEKKAAVVMTLQELVNSAPPIRDSLLESDVAESMTYVDSALPDATAANAEKTSVPPFQDVKVTSGNANAEKTEAFPPQAQEDPEELDLFEVDDSQLRHLKTISSKQTKSAVSRSVEGLNLLSTEAKSFAENAMGSVQTVQKLVSAVLSIVDAASIAANEAASAKGSKEPSIQPVISPMMRTRIASAISVSLKHLRGIFYNAFQIFK